MAEIKFISAILPAMLCAITAVIYHAVLIEKVFERPHARLRSWVDGMAGTWIYPYVEFITHSLRECAYCLAGQLALVCYVLTAAFDPSFTYAFGLLFQTALAIFFSIPVLKKTLEWLK